jgi:hypothetical protein
MGRHAMLGQVTGRHAVPVITTLSESISPLCPHRTVTSRGSWPLVTCPVHPRPADTYLQSPAERAWYVSHVGPLPANAGRPGYGCGQSCCVAPDPEAWVWE